MTRDEERPDWRDWLRELAEGNQNDGYLGLIDELVLPGRTAAAAEALPELLAHAEDGTARLRHEVLDVVSQLVHAEGAADERWPAAWAAAVPRLAALLGDSVHGVRQGATLALGAASDPAVLPVLLDLWPVERAEPVRVGLLLAIGELGGEDVLPWLAERNETPAIAVAALVSIARSTGAAQVGRLVEALCGDLSAFVGAYGFDAPGHVVVWVAAHLSPRLRTEVLTGLVARSERQSEALWVAAGIVARRPSATAELLPVVAAALDGPERGAAAALLAGVAPASAEYADRLFGLVADETAVGYDDQVRDYALWALLRLKDRRCVEPLLSRFDQRETVLSTVGSPRTHDLWTPFRAPGAHQVLADAPEFAADFLPWICGRLGPRTHRFTVYPLTRLLQAWGPVGAAAAPHLAQQLDARDPITVELCADTLAEIGADDELSMAALKTTARCHRLPLAARRAAATAQARLGGDSSLAVTLLQPGILKGDAKSVGWGASLGKLGAPLEGVLRAYKPQGLRDQVAVAYATARVTGDVGEALPVLLRALADVDAAQIGWAATDAMRALAKLGPLPAEVAPVLRELLARDDRFARLGGCDLFLDDEEFRRDVARALANCA
ncbi:HEAT repeat domain-containing protein [Amycolatopsis sp. NPDC058278]|uniref:HEAT repeat domain-containing protein n=1 Tax=Amycolatopsis sp. NPDC058278 TaxID=3346417 RepID=UPI0036DE9629